jgi:choline dehydrogenase-like flavoprotein
MIESADALCGPAVLEADLCILGAGPAGIAIALAAAQSRLRVIVLEAGGRRPDVEGQAGCAGEVAEGSLHAPPDWFRRRGLGGASTVWGGRCMTLDAVDFAARPWLGLPSGWPITHESLQPYWRRAHALAELGAYTYSARNAVAGGMRPMFAGFCDAAVTTDPIERFSRPTDFGVTYGERLARGPHIRVLLHATCADIVLEPGLQAVRQVICRTRAGAALPVRAAAFVLAVGGLELPRLLLASRNQIAAGIGNMHDQVGRHYMCHLAGIVGAFIPTPGTRPWHGYERDADGVYCRRRVAIAPWAQRAAGMGNAIARLHHPRIGDPAHRTGALSALHLVRGLVPPEYRVRLTDQAAPARLLAHIGNVMRDPAATAGFFWQMLQHRILAARKYPSVVVHPACGRYALDMHVEQVPNPDSRVLLSGTPDRFGVPQLRIDWRHRPADIHTVRATLALLAAALHTGGHGTLVFDPDRVEADILRDGAYGGHHLGTARMSASPRTGVVDANCRVHGLANLYVAGGAVFATSGQANPTLTILALALRLAEHLAETIPGAGTAAPVQMRRPVAHAGAPA